MNAQSEITTLVYVLIRSDFVYDGWSDTQLFASGDAIIRQYPELTGMYIPIEIWETSRVIYNDILYTVSLTEVNQ